MTSPSCDCAYWLMPTVALSPSFFTHSWVSANRVPLRSAIVTPFPSFRMRPLVEGQRHHLGRGGGATNVHAKTGPGRGQRRWDIRHPDVVAEGEGDVARRYRADPLAVVDHHVAMPGNTAIERLEPDQDPVEPAVPGLHDGVAADEVLVEVEGPIEAGLERIRAGVDVVAVEAHSGFQPQRVPGAEAGRPDPVRLTFLEQRAPQADRILVATKQFEAVFARVAGPRDHARNVRDLALDEGVVLDAAQLRRCQALHQADRARPLHADQRPVTPDVEDAPTLPSPPPGGG